MNNNLIIKVGLICSCIYVTIALLLLLCGFRFTVLVLISAGIVQLGMTIVLMGLEHCEHIYTKPTEIEERPPLQDMVDLIKEVEDV